jgi:hypothetical protein
MSVDSARARGILVGVSAQVAGILLGVFSGIVSVVLFVGGFVEQNRANREASERG